MTTNSTTAAIVDSVLSKMNNDVKKYIYNSNIIDTIINERNKDINNILNQQNNNPAPTKNWWDGLDIQTYSQSSHTIVGWALTTEGGSTTYYPLFDVVDNNTLSTNVFSDIDNKITEYYNLLGGISLDDEIDLGTKVIGVKAICLDEFKDKYEFEKKIYWNGVEEFQKYISEKSLKDALKTIIEREYRLTMFFK